MNPQVTRFFDFSESALSPFFHWMIAMSWQLAIMVAILALLTWCLRHRTSARFRYALWLIVPVRLVLPPTLALVVGWGWWCLPSQSQPETRLAESSSKIESSPNAGQAVLPELIHHSRFENRPSSRPDGLTDSTGAPNHSDNDSGSAALNDLTEDKTKADAGVDDIAISALGVAKNGSQIVESGGESDRTASPLWPVLILLTWLACVSFLMFRIFKGLIQVRFMIRHGEPANELTIEVAQACQQQVGLKKTVQVLVSPHVTTPMLVGVIRPVILLPVDCDRHLDSGELESVLVHELQHVSRRDPLIHFVTSLLAAVYWFHPAVWISQWQLRRLRELACDEATIATLSNTRKSYASGLVKVAELISNKHPIPAVGFIERKKEMSQRVIKILDARTRVGRGVSLLGLLSILTIGLVLIPGAGRPAEPAPGPVDQPETTAATPSETTQDEQESTKEQKPNAENATQEKPEKSTDEKSTDEDDEPKPSGPPEKLDVTVTDEQGTPLEGVNFFANSVTKKLLLPAIENKNFSSNDKGVAEIDLPSPLTMSRIWASKPGFVPVFFSWEEGNTNSMPATYEIILQPATSLSGIVVDREGQPIAGAKVEVSRFGGGIKVDPKERVRLGTWLAHGEDMAETDKDGKWSINNVPAGNDLRLSFRLEHPDFINDKSRRKMGQYEVTLEQLRNGTASFTMKKGIPISGVVTDDEGNPVTKGLVIWGDRPYWETGSQEVEIGEDGKFLVPPQLEEKLRLTVVAPGWMPQDRVIDLSASDIGKQDFALKRGKNLQLKFVDDSGKPIPNVYVSVGKWHGQEALYSMVHPNVKKTQIPRGSDKQGVYSWDWAPDDLIKMKFGVRPWLYTKSMDIVATDELQTITLRKPFELSGDVVDSETGKPVTKFSIVPVTFQSISNSARGIAQQSQVKNFNSSEFKFDGAFRNDDGRLVAYRFQAVGYRDFTTDRFTADTPSLKKTIRLQPAEMRSVRVKQTDGTVCTDARVWVAKPDQGTMVNSFGDYFSGLERALSLDQNGEVQYGSPATPHAIVVASSAGYAEKYLAVDEDPGELTLRPWASLEGVLYQAGKPVPGASVFVSPIRQLGGNNPHVQDSFQTTTDANGRFVFKKLPPVPSVVRSMLSPWREFPITSSRQLPVDLQPGKTHQVSLGGGGITLTGKVNLVGDNADKIQLRYGLNKLVRIDGGVATPKHARHASQFETGSAKQWNEKLTADLDPNVARESFFVKIQDDGTLLVSGVQSGRYRFLIKMYEPPTGCLVEPVGFGYLEFSTEGDDVKDDTLDLGTIDIQLKPMPKVGDTLPDFRFRDMEGKQHQISEFRGKHVMIDFWASWCLPCIKAFPDLAKINDSIAKRDNAAMISISVDEEIDSAKTVALREQLAWMVGFAGKSAEEGSSASALGVSALPMYLVLDPDGKIIYRGFDHSEAAKLLPGERE